MIKPSVFLTRRAGIGHQELSDWTNEHVHLRSGREEFFPANTLGTGRLDTLKQAALIGHLERTNASLGRSASRSDTLRVTTSRTPLLPRRLS
jgi:hypothetical protein